MDYEEAYKNIINDIDLAIAGTRSEQTRICLENIKQRNTESEDERIRKELMNFVATVKDIAKSGRDSWAVRKEDIEMCERFLAYLEKQKENPKNADSIPADCASNAKCEDRWHKVEDSLPDDAREVICKDAIGNYFIGRYYECSDSWEVMMYDDYDKSNEDNPPVVMWVDIPSEKQKEQKPVKNDTRTKIVSRATSEEQVVLLSESNGNTEIGWDTRSLEDTKKLLEYGIAFINKQLGAKWQKEQKPAMIQWKGDNLKEVIDFTGLSPKFGEWFKSWDEYEDYVHSHNDILKLFYEDGSHYEVPVGAWIVKTPDGHNIPVCFTICLEARGVEQEDDAMVRFYEADYNNEIGDMPMKEVIENRLKFKEWLTNKLKYLRPRQKTEGIRGKSKEIPSNWKPSLGEKEIICLKRALDYLRKEQNRYGGSDTDFTNEIAVLEWLITHPVLVYSSQPHWKPSEEQMKSLNTAYRLGKLGKTDMEVLQSLYNDIKTL